MSRFLKFGVVVWIVVALIVGGLLFFALASGNASEEDMCSMYKYSSVNDMPAYCLKYYR